MSGSASRTMSQFLPGDVYEINITDWQIERDLLNGAEDFPQGAHELYRARDLCVGADVGRFARHHGRWAGGFVGRPELSALPSGRFWHLGRGKFGLVGP